MQDYNFLSEDINFPHPKYADEDGLLAIGGDLSLERLILAYQYGIYPCYGEGQPILWWAPNPRFVLFLNDFTLSKKQIKTINKKNFIITENTCFKEVIKYCANIKRIDEDGDIAEAWILPEMQKAYINLHKNNLAHSIEVWHTEQPQKGNKIIQKEINGTIHYLVGGLYGVLISKVFSGESMFTLTPEASRAGVAYLVQKLKNHGHILLDCQMESPHFARMGAKNISREEFMSYL